MRYVKTTSVKEIATYLAQTIQSHLDKEESVVWIVSGGSAVTVAVQAAKLLTKGANLTVTLADERYGAVGHSDSNWQALLNEGFEIAQAHPEPVLHNLPVGETAAKYEQLIEGLFQRSDYKIALLGIGPDGHTAGILPHSPATDTERLVKYYEGDDYQRLTLTPKALLKLDEALVFVQGQAKWPQLEQLDSNLPIATQPAQVLKYIPKVTIFNDLRGEEI